MPNELSTAIVELKNDTAVNMVKNKLDSGEDHLQILEECRRGMTTVGDLFQKGDYFLAELMLSAEIFKEAVAIIEPRISNASQSEPLGKVVLATMKGDIHDLGKNILATLLRAHSFEVYDLGVDVAPHVLLVNVKNTKPDFVGFSALITTAFDSMKETVELLEEAGMRDQLKVMVGGGVTTPQVRDYVGGDFQTNDATEGVSYCIKVAVEK